MILKGKHHDIPNPNCDDSFCYWDKWTSLAQDITIVTACTLTLIVSCCVRRRSEFFFIATPLLFALSCSVSLFLKWLQYTGIDPATEPDTFITIGLDVTS